MQFSWSGDKSDGSHRGRQIRPINRVPKSLTAQIDNRVLTVHDGGRRGK